MLKTLIVQLIPLGKLPLILHQAMLGAISHLPTKRNCISVRRIDLMSTIKHWNQTVQS